MDFPNQNQTPVQPMSPTAGPMPGVYPSPVTSIPVMSMPSTPPVPTAVPPTQPAMSNSDAVYTMPEKFLNTTAASTSGKPTKKRSWLTLILIVIIALAVLGIIGGIVYIVLQSRQAAQVVEDTNTVVNDTNVANTNTINANAVNTNTTNTNTTNTNVVNTNVANTNTVNANAVNTNTTNTNTTNTNVATDTLGQVGITNTNTAGAKPASKDTDKDQLTNEEESLYGTKADLPDTDNDSYNDGVEVIAGYDPISSTSSSRIANSALVTNYINSDYHYGISYPSKWLAEALSEGSNAEILFTPKSLDTAGQFVEVIVADNPTGYTAVDWYVDQTKANESKLTTITSFSGLQGVLSTDGYTAYYTDNDHVYAISYRFGTSPELYFQSTFTLLYKSFGLNVAAAATNTNSNVNGNANTNKNKNNSNY